MAMPAGSAAAGGWIDLRPADEAGAAGCLLVLAAILIVLGGGILAVFVLAPVGKGDAWVMPVVGGAFFLVGALLLYAGIRGARGQSVPPPQLAVEGGLPLCPGSRVRARLRQPGPATIESLTVSLTCRREYRRKVRPNSSSTVPDHEVLWEQVLLKVSDEEVAQGGVLEREFALALPPEAAPTGPAVPDGRVRWKIEVAAEAGFLRARYRAFDVRVEGARPVVLESGAEEAASAAAKQASASEWSAVFDRGVAAPAEREATGRRTHAHRHQGAGRGRSGLSFNAGCLVIAVLFVLCGSIFLWLFFSGAAFRGRGNPYMALFGGLLFAGVGLLGILGVVLSSVGSGKKKR